MDKEINFLMSFFKDEKDAHAIEAITKSIQRVKESSGNGKEDTKESIRELFAIIAHCWYLKNTKKTWEELASGYLSYDVYSWSDGLIGDEWKKDDIINIIESAILEADFYLSQEK